MIDASVAVPEREKGSERSFAKLLPLLIPSLYSLIVAYLLTRHDTFEEWDGVMQLFAGREIVAGLGYNGWTSHFWPPLYSFLIGLADIFMSGFAAAKLISALSGVFLLYIVHHLTLELTGNRVTGTLSQAFLAVNPLFLTASIQAENHMLDSLFFVMALLLLLRALRIPQSDERERLKGLFIVGLVAGLAGLTRYTSYILYPLGAAAVLLAGLSYSHKRASSTLSLVASFSAGFVVVSLPWWLYNTIANGAPLHSWQYMNIGSRLYPNGREWWWSAQAGFDGLWDIFRRYPDAYLKNFKLNLLESYTLLTAPAILGALAPLGIPSALEFLLRLRPRQGFIVFGGLTLFICLVSQAFVFSEVFLNWTVILTSLSTVFLYNYLRSLGKKYANLRRFHFDKMVIAAFLAWGILFTHETTMSYIANDDIDGGQLVDRAEVTRALNAYDAELSNKYIMAIHPARAYYAETNWLMLPLHYRGSLEELVAYEGLSSRVLDFAPKYPSTVQHPRPAADYLIFDTAASRHLRQFSFLLDAKSDAIPNHFKTVYRSPRVVVFRVAAD